MAGATENARAEPLANRTRGLVGPGISSQLRDHPALHPSGQRDAARSSQTKLTISHPGDIYEQEAERVADQVMRMADPPPQIPSVSSLHGAPPVPSLQRLCAECEEELTADHNAPIAHDHAARVLRQEEAASVPEVSPSVVTNIHAMQGSGSRLPTATRAFFEPRFGADFSHVRVHTGSRADETAKSISAKAFTVGADIAFASGQYSPESGEGQKLLAHELTHVLQQNPRELQRAIYQSTSYAPNLPSLHDDARITGRPEISSSSLERSVARSDELAQPEWPRGTRVSRKSDDQEFSRVENSRAIDHVQLQRFVRQHEDSCGTAQAVHSIEPTRHQSIGAIIQRGFLGDLGDAVSGGVSSIAKPVSELAGGAVDAVSGVASSAANKVSDLAAGAVDAVSGVASSAAKKVSDLGAGAVDAVSAVASSAAKKVSDLAAGAADTVSRVIDSTMGRLRGAFDSILAQINGGWAVVKNGATNAVDEVIQHATGFLGGIGAPFGAIGTALKSLDVDSLRTVWAAITGATDTALAGIRGLAAQATATVDGLWSGLKGLADRLIGGLQSQASGLIGRLPGPAQAAAHLLWSKIDAKLTSAWQAIESGWGSLRLSALDRVNQVFAAVEKVVMKIRGSIITTIIATVDQVSGLFTFFKKVMANPDTLVEPMVKDIAGRLHELPTKARGFIETEVLEKAAGGSSTTTAVPGGIKAAPSAAPNGAPTTSAIQGMVQRAAAPGGHTRSTLSVGEVISGCWQAITNKLASLKLGEIIKETVLSLVWPPAIKEALKKDWAGMSEELSTRASRFESIRTDSWAGFGEDIGRFFSNLADFPLIIQRTANAMLGRLSVYIGLALVLGGGAVGFLLGGTGGAGVGSVVPVAGTAAGGGLGGGAGFVAGATVGYGLAQTVGLVLLLTFLITENVSIHKAIIDLLAIPQSEEEQHEDLNQAADSTIAATTAGLLMAIAYVASYLAKLARAAVKRIPGRFRPKPKVIEPDAAGQKPVPKPGSGDNLVICRILKCDTVPGVPDDLMAQRAKLSPEMRQFLDSKVTRFFPDPANPTPNNFKALRGFMENAAKKGGGDLEAGLRKIAPKAPPSGPPHGTAVGELPRLRLKLEQTIAEIEDFVKANPGNETMERPIERLKQQLDGPVSNMENGRLEASPEQVNTVDRAIKGVQDELKGMKVAPKGTLFNEIVDNVEIDQIRPDGTYWQRKAIRALRKPSRLYDETVAQVKRTLVVAQNNPVGGRPRNVVFEFPEGLSKDIADDFRTIQVNGQRATIIAEEIIVPPK